MRTKAERLANAGQKKRGKNIELFRIITIQQAIDIGCDNILIRVAGAEANCRDIDDVKAVMVERDIVGTIVPMRRAGEPIERAMQTVAAFVTPKSCVDCSEVKGKEQEDGDK